MRITGVGEGGSRDILYTCRTTKLNSTWPKTITCSRVALFLQFFTVSVLSITTKSQHFFQKLITEDKPGDVEHKNLFLYIFTSTCIWLRSRHRNTPCMSKNLTMHRGIHLPQIRKLTSSCCFEKNCHFNHLLQILRTNQGAIFLFFTPGPYKPNT